MISRSAAKAATCKLLKFCLRMLLLSAALTLLLLLVHFSVFLGLLAVFLIGLTLAWHILYVEERNK